MNATGLSALLGVVLCLAGAGCVAPTEITSSSEERAPDSLQAKRKIAGRVLAYSEGAEAHQGNRTITEQVRDPNPKGPAPPTVVQSESLKVLLLSTGIFDDVDAVPEPKLPREFDALLLSLKPTASPEVSIVWRWDATDVAVPFQLVVSFKRGEILATYTTTAKVHSSGEGSIGCMQALKAAREHAQRVLVGKLLADERALERIASALGGGARPAAPAAPAAPATRPPTPPPAAPLPEQGSVHVLVIGVNEYDDAKIPKLRFAEQDARTVFGFFATDKKSPTIRERVHLLLGKDATRQGILRAIREELISKATRPDDLAILYFAGHGFQDADDTYLAGSDAQLASLPETAISGATIAEYWKKILAGRRVFLVDACHSGGIEGVRGIGGVVRAPVASDRKEPGKPDGSSLTIAATGPSELSTEDPTLGQGVFTLALLRGLRGEADANGDGRVTGDELAGYLKKEVPSLAAQAKGKQTPSVESSGGATIWLTR